MDLQEEAVCGVSEAAGTWQLPPTLPHADACDDGWERKGVFFGIIFERCLVWFNIV